MRSAPQLVCDRTLNKFSALRHFARYVIWGINESFRSKITSRNFASSSTGMREPYRYSSGSLCTFFSWQKCTHCVFDLENLKPLYNAHFSILFRHCWDVFQQFAYFFIYNICRNHQHIMNHPFFRSKQFTILFILILNSVVDMMPPCGTPCFCSNRSDKVEPTRTCIVRSARKLLIKIGNRPFSPYSCKSRKIPCLQVVS